METILKADRLKKTFRLSRKQMKLNRTDSAYKVAVDSLSFEVYKGEIFGLLGPNGAGKTTTLRMIATLIQPDEGDCYIDQVSVKKSPDIVRKKIGFLTSDLKLEDFFTPSYLYDFFSKLHDVPNEIAKERKKDYFHRFGIEDFQEIKISELSTGMRQKVSLIISLVHDPDLIIFDEPTNGLDVLTAKVVTDFLLDLKARGKTILLSTHIYSLVEKICDRVGVVINGKMICVDTLENLTKEKSLEDVFFDIYSSEVKE